MDPERWKRIDSLLQDALALSPGERDGFLQAACAGDEGLQREVHSLLKSQHMAGTFLERPAMEVEARELASEWSGEAPEVDNFSTKPLLCRVCSFPIPEGARFCGGCAMPVAPQGNRPQTTPADGSTPSPDEGELAAGTALASRYTVLELVGRGGMGEVYRVRDNKLDQVVALKLLAESLRGNTSALIALHKEVRLARQVSHPNVCRVYDIGEADGMHFLTMEFVDGGDLAHLLRRIGRFPHDRAVEISRQICAALSAAHERGVLHRDLKPANIMLNAAGHVVVTDFGLAALDEEMKAVESRSGTPAYMSPEQVAGGKVSIRSDIYALGLVLYELFTGRRAFQGENRTALTNPSALVKDLHPDVEHVILRCLAEDPNDRPATAMAVAASLPGGDLLAVALAAGQTPPPEMVAASGEKVGISVRSAICCLAAAMAGLTGVLMFGDGPQVLTRAATVLPPDSLAVKARELAASVGYSEPPGGCSFGFLYDTPQIRLLERNGWSAPALSRPSPVRFWYRESLRGLASYELKGVSWDDPPPNSPGMISIQMDGAGRLTFFRALPIDVQAVPAVHEPPWSALVSAAGLDPHSLRATDPQVVPPVFADSRIAWNASYLDLPETLVRVEAAAVVGHPVFFEIIPAWEGSSTGTRSDRTGLDVAFQITARPYPPSYTGTVLTFLTIWTIVAGQVAWRNLKSGRGDRSGAFRVAVFVFVLWTVYGLSIGFGQLAGAPERSWIIVANSLFWAANAWVCYVALEPLVRRNWPRSLFSWSRLVSGKLRDPLVGRDILIGILVASWFFLIRARLPIVIGSAIPSHMSAFIGILPVSLAASASGTLLVSVIFTLTLVISRQRWAAYILSCIALFLMNFFLAASAGRDWMQVLAAGVYSLAMVVVLTRFGVLALYTAMATSYLLFALPLGINLSAWYQDDGRICIFLLGALALYGFQSALAGRRVLSGFLS